MLANTPNSKLIKRPTSDERKKQRRKIEDKVKKGVAKQMDGQATVLQNRVSWRKYDNIRRTNGLTAATGTPNRKRPSSTPSAKKRHGSKVDSLQLDKEKLLSEARQCQRMKQ